MALFLYGTINRDNVYYISIERTIGEKVAGESHPKRKKGLQAQLDSGWILLKVDIETNKQDRRQILKYLNRMNINHATLFPDVEGASLYANMQGDIPHY